VRSKPMRGAVLAAVLTLGVRAAAGEQPARPFPVEGMEGFIGQIVDSIRAMNAGDGALAFSKIDAVSYPERKVDEAFRREVVGQYERAVQLNFDFESVEFVGVRRHSSGACHAYLVAHSRLGPILFEVRAYRYRSQWWVDGLDWERLFHEKMKSRLDFPKFETPYVYSLDEEVEATSATSR
jgi:hypothetical protein